MSALDPMKSCTRYAFRLEVLPFYRGGHVGKRFDAYLHVPLNELPIDHEWVDTINSARQRGCRMMRLRLLSDPLSAYERYEIDAGYRPGMAAGEEIRLRVHPDRSDLIDFWAYDDEWIEELHYSEEGILLRGDLRRMNEQDIKTVHAWMDEFEESRLLK